jgi:hypothetical protein
MAFCFHFARYVTEIPIYLAVTRDFESFLFGSEVPIQDKGLTLRVAGHPFPVPAELRVVGREQLQAGQRPLPELVDDGAVTEDALDLPVGGQRTEVDDPDVPLGRLWLLELLGCRGHGVGG